MAAAAKTMGEILLNKGHELQEEHKALLAKRAANRRSLRDLDAQELLTEDESDQVGELYPERRTREEVEADELAASQAGTEG